MLKQRIITGLVLAGGALWALYGWSNLWFGLFLLVATFCCAWEWAALGGLGYRPARAMFSIAVTVVTALTLWFGSIELLKVPVLLVVLGWLAIVLDLYVRPAVAVTNHAVRWPLLFLAASILMVSVASLYWLRDEMTASFIVYIVALVAAADIGAYFCGRRFGKRKLAVQISAGKTIEGAAGGVVAAVLLALICVHFFSGAETSRGALFTFSIIAALFSIAGDLFISRAKRSTGVKDSGHLLPGHGGVLDRFDGLLAAIPWMTFVILWT